LAAPFLAAPFFVALFLTAPFFAAVFLAPLFFAALFLVAAFVARNRPEDRFRPLVITLFGGEGGSLIMLYPSLLAASVDQENLETAA
jgi:hypothetical protein